MRLRGRERDPNVARLLALAQIQRDPDGAAERGPHIAAEYASAPDLHLFGWIVAGKVVGVVGVQPFGGAGAVIRDLAVAPETRGQGVGRALIDYLRDTLRFDALEGDSLEPSVEFYRACGFTVAPNGTMPDGATRYRFAWER